MCSINLGEILFQQIRLAGFSNARDAVGALRRLVKVVDPDWDLVRSAAVVKSNGGLSFADAFCIATASRLDLSLWTGDPEIVDRDDRTSCSGCEIVDLCSPSA